MTQRHSATQATTLDAWHLEESQIQCFTGTPKINRLRDAGLRPTVARMATLLVFDCSKGEGIGINEVIRRMAELGVRVGIGSAHRAIRELAKHGLVQRCTDDEGKVLYQGIQGSAARIGSTCTSTASGGLAR
ncbi:hypothetical protein G7048_25020 (plasmid) [Diaphorobacter sp. HDW4B]|uniref:transcriptional repressor n=1 Tax=Diaphorobacter sp. HDW4B TaxID=2714925 RepID=UPI00140AA4CE|nr:transcriptional repressor [Diaphorobacter sp. HDW4B]QIL73775.1 hypothetical protein G7048_25020 [Diaphorobacter sp. HDW4B]